MDHFILLQMAKKREGSAASEVNLGKFTLYVYTLYAFTLYGAKLYFKYYKYAVLNTGDTIIIWLSCIICTSYITLDGRW